MHSSERLVPSTQPSLQYISADIELTRKKRYDGVSGCIGAVDGTVTRAYLPAGAQGPWYGRKLSAPSQSVFAAVRFSTAFSYVLAGAEGYLVYTLDARPKSRARH